MKEKFGKPSIQNQQENPTDLSISSPTWKTLSYRSPILHVSSQWSCSIN